MENQFLFDDFEVQKDALPEGKSVDVFNALSLSNESLGRLYVEQGYNPFGENFVLTEEYTDEILQNKINASNIQSESFLENSNSEVSKNFTTSLENSEALLTALENQEFSESDPRLKKQIKRTVVSLKNRNELLKLNIAKLKQKDANALRMYIELYGMDGELGELLKDTFTEKANHQVLLMRLMAIIQKRAGTVYAKAQNLKNKNLNEANLDEEIEKAVAQSRVEAENRTNAERQVELERQRDLELQKLKEQEEQAQKIRKEELEKAKQNKDNNKEDFSR